MPKTETRVLNFVCLCFGGWIPVEGNQSTGRRKSGKNQSGMSPASKSAIDIGSIFCRGLRWQVLRHVE
jgi:hypothetical protein